MSGSGSRSEYNCKSYSGTTQGYTALHDALHVHGAPFDAEWTTDCAVPVEVTFKRTCAQSDHDVPVLSCVAAQLEGGSSLQKHAQQPDTACADTSCHCSELRN